LSAPAENYLWGRPDLRDPITRLQAFSDVGADVLYIPGLPDIAAIRTVCGALDKPVNVLMGLSGKTYSVEELPAVSVSRISRISVEGSFRPAALGALKHAAEDVLSTGTVADAANAMSDHAISRLMAQDHPVAPH
jgi:2-methylisocitrate lyase-like PEP mutase family enzyme